MFDEKPRGRARLAGFVACLLAAGIAHPADYLGPSALAPSKDGTTLYVAAADARQVLAVDLAYAKVTTSIAVSARPTGLVVAPDGGKLYVTCAGPQSIVAVIDTASRRIVSRLAAGHTACGPALSPDGRRLYVCNRFDGDLSVIDLMTDRTLARVAVSREPLAAAVTPNGQSVVVANHLPTGKADSFFVTPQVTLIDTRSRETVAIRLPNGSTGLHGVCISPDGRYAFVTHVLSNYELVPAQVVGGWTNLNALSVIDVVGKRLLNTIKLDNYYRGAANPWGVACSRDGRWLCIAHAGTDELSVIDLPGLLAKLHDGTYVLPTAGGVPNSPGILAGLRRRVKLPGKGARAVAVVGKRAYVGMYFSDLLVAVPLEGKTLGGPQPIPLGPRPRWTAQRRGEVLFHDATICFQHWQSCASCHPDARADGFNWDLTNDGVGNPKNTKSMLLAHRTPPAMSTGVRATAEVAVRSGLEHILFAKCPEEDAAAIDAYLKSLQPVPSPHLIDGRLGPSARRGRELFGSQRIGCHRCHPGPLYTDLRAHDVGTQGPYDFRTRFDTPALVESWRTAPYLHDGRYATIRELLAEGRHGLSGGLHKQLTPEEIEDLAAFVLSL